MTYCPRRSIFFLALFCGHSLLQNKRIFDEAPNCSQFRDRVAREHFDACLRDWHVSPADQARDSLLTGELRRVLIGEGF
jgi:hypothetical protein